MLASLVDSMHRVPGHPLPCAEWRRGGVWGGPAGMPAPSSTVLKLLCLQMAPHPLCVQEDAKGGKPFGLPAPPS